MIESNQCKYEDEAAGFESSVVKGACLFFFLFLVFTVSTALVIEGI